MSDWDDFLNHCWNLSNLSLYDNSFRRHFNYSCVHNNISNKRLNFFYLHYIVSHLNYFFHNLGYLYYMLFCLIYWNKLLNDPLNRNWNLNRNYNWSFNFNNVLSINIVCYDSFNFNLSWNFTYYFYYSLLYNIMGKNFFLINGSINNSIPQNLDRFFDLNINVFDSLNLYNLLLNNWNLYDFFDLSNNFSNNFLFNRYFHNLRDFNNFLYNSWNNNNFFYNFLNFYNFRNFYHFLDDFIDSDSNLFDSFDNFGNLNNFLLNMFDWPRDINVMINNFIHLDYFWFINDYRVIDLDFHDFSFNKFLDDCLSNYLWYFNHSFMNHRNLDPSLHHLLNLLN